MNPYIISTTGVDEIETPAENLRVCIRTWNCHAYKDPMMDIFNDPPDADIIVVTLQEALRDVAYGFQADEYIKQKYMMRIRAETYLNKEHSELGGHLYKVFNPEFASFGLTSMFTPQGLVTVILVRADVQQKYDFVINKKLSTPISLDSFRNKGALLTTLQSNKFPLKFCFINVHFHAHEDHGQGWQYAKQRVKDFIQITNNRITKKIFEDKNEKSLMFVCGDFNFRTIDNLYWKSKEHQRDQLRGGMFNIWQESEEDKNIVHKPTYKLRKAADHIYWNPFSYLGYWCYDPSRMISYTDRIFMNQKTHDALVKDSVSYHVLKGDRWQLVYGHCVKCPSPFVHSDHLPVEWCGTINCSLP